MFREMALMVIDPAQIAPSRCLLSIVDSLRDALASTWARMAESTHTELVALDRQRPHTVW